MFNNIARTGEINVMKEQLSEVEKYICLGQQIKEDNTDKLEEFQRRIAMGWSSFGKLKGILLNSNIPLNLKTKLFDS
jgi:hypothetical protein